LAGEARARIKINQLLEKAGWRFFGNEHGPANIELEAGTKITQKQVDAFGEDFETNHQGFLDFLLLDEQGFPFIILEAKRESKNPLDGKEQARTYARSQNVRFILLSNGNLHYFWDLEHGNPEVITEFPRCESIKHREAFKPNPKRLADEKVGSDYIAISQNPTFQKDPRWIDEEQRSAYTADQGLRILRDYQVEAIHKLQESAATGSDRFLFEMATGTGKTLVSAAVIKLFLKTGNAKRVLFLVDRLELEDQAYKNFVRYLKNDFITVIYKENRDDWRKAEIVVTTVQSLTFDNKYMRLFSPTDFDLVISDEAHRSINGNSRAVFEYFVGYKLGLTATPRDYIKHIDIDALSQNDPRAWERRQLLDTYKTFGCESGEPTYRYSLIDGVKDGYLISPIVADARTDITTQLLSEKGYAVMVESDEGEEEEQIFHQTHFERKFFSEKTNQIICQTFLRHALRDPISGEAGKSIVFCVSQNHASKITQILNQYADALFPGKYNSDFAVQITSTIPNAQQFASNFSNNNLNSHSRFMDDYKTSKTRVCVTVGMMTTGYDCQDILNLCMVRPIFSPTDFIQIKGRGTRTFTFKRTEKVDGHRQETQVQKAHFKLFDFFANCEYFEEKFDYDEVIHLPKESSAPSGGGKSRSIADELSVFNPDPITSFTETTVGAEGMRIDRELFDTFSRPIQADAEIAEAVTHEQWEKAIQILRARYENKPEDFVTLEKLMRAEKMDRRLTWKEVLQRTFGLIDGFKSKDALLDEEFNKFVAIHKPDNKYALLIKNYLKAYITDEEIRAIVSSGAFAQLATNPKLPLADYQALNGWREVVPAYVKDYVVLNTYLQ
jgi:type I restriction enzyme, R subunit